MADPDLDHGFILDDQGLVDVLRSPFFDIIFGNGHTAEEYVDLIIFSLAAAIDHRLPPVQWQLIYNLPVTPCLGAGIDLSSLIVVEGKVCWDLYIDGLVISSDGNLLDALAAAIKAALSNTGIPKVNVSLGASAEDQPEVDVSDEDFMQFDTSGVPVIVTLTKVGRHYIVDATSEEESQMSSAVSVSVNRHGRICGLTKRGGTGLDPSVVLDMISVAKHASESLIAVLDSEIAAAEPSDDEC